MSAAAAPVTPRFLSRVVAAMVRTFAPDTRAGVTGVTQWGPIGWSTVSGGSPGQYEQTGRAVRTQGFEQNPVAHAVIRIVSDMPGAVPLEGYTKGAGGEAQVLPHTHPFQRLLDSPCGVSGQGLSAHRLRNLTTAHLLSYGNAYWVYDRGGRNGAPVGLKLVHPEFLQYVYRNSETLEPAAYVYTDFNGRAYTVPATDVTHFRDLTLYDWIFGFPRMAAALLDIVTDGEASQFVRQIISNSGMPGAIVSSSAITTKEQAEIAEARWQEKMTARGNRGRVVFMPGDAKFDKVGFDLTQLEFPSLRAISREDICAVAGVDPRMVGIASAKGKDGGLSGVQYKEARQRLYLQTVAPLMLLIESEIDNSLAPEFGDVYCRFSAEALAEVTENMDETSIRAAREYTAGIIGLKEARAMTGREADPDAGDFLLLPGTGTLRAVPEALADAATQTPTPEPTNASGDLPAPDAPSALPAGEPTAPATKALPRATATVLHSRVIERGTVLTEAHKAALWQSFDARATDAEGAYRVAAMAQLDTDRAAVARAFAQSVIRSETGIAAPGEDPDDEILGRIVRWMSEHFQSDDTGESFKEWKARFTRLLGPTLHDAGAEIAAHVGTSWTLENPRVRDAVHRRVNRLAGNVTTTTRDEIRALIASGRAAGLGVKTIAKMIDEAAFEGRNPARAELIARTEIVGALNEGEFLAAQATGGVLTTKRWLSKRDPKVRDEHAACDDEGDIPLEARFAATDMLYPGDAAGGADQVCNCRCTLLFGSA